MHNTAIKRPARTVCALKYEVHFSGSTYGKPYSCGRIVVVGTFRNEVAATSWDVVFQQQIKERLKKLRSELRQNDSFDLQVSVPLILRTTEQSARAGLVDFDVRGENVAAITEALPHFIADKLKDIAEDLWED